MIHKPSTPSARFIFFRFEGKILVLNNCIKGVFYAVLELFEVKMRLGIVVYH